MKLQVGDVVTCKVREKAYYSGYMLNDECFFEKGMLGVVSNIDVPYVRGKESTFSTVDFESDATYGGYDSSLGKTIWRCGLANNNIKLVPQPLGTVICLRNDTTKSEIRNDMLNGRSIYYRNDTTIRVQVAEGDDKFDTVHVQKGNLYKAVRVFNRLKMDPGWTKRIWLGPKGEIEAEVIYTYQQPK